MLMYVNKNLIKPAVMSYPLICYVLKEAARFVFNYYLNVCAVIRCLIPVTGTQRLCLSSPYPVASSLPAHSSKQSCMQILKAIMHYIVWC